MKVIGQFHAPVALHQWKQLKVRYPGSFAEIINDKSLTETRCGVDITPILYSGGVGFKSQPGDLIL
jgi:hypothetical protein